MNRILNAAILAAALSSFPFAALAQGPPNAPFAAQAKMTSTQALQEAPKDDTDLAPLAKSFNGDATRLKKAPKDAKVKKAYVDSGVKYEQKIVRSSNKLSPAVKYRAGLALCRLILAADPKNPVAKKDMDEIVTIYKSMGRPIPK